MTPALIATIVAFVNMAVQYAPDLVHDGRVIVDLITRGTDPTPEEQADIDARMAQTHEKLQAAIAAALAAPSPEQAVS